MLRGGTWSFWLPWWTVAGLGVRPRGWTAERGLEFFKEAEGKLQLGKSFQKASDPEWGCRGGRLSGLWAGWAEAIEEC